MIAVGPGARKENGERIPPNVKAGDNVVFGQYTGDAITIDNEDYLIMRENMIYGILR